MVKGRQSENIPLEEGGDKNGDVAMEMENAKRQSTSSSNGQQYVTPPDGGWGWVVVVSSFLIHVIADGIVYSFGVFLMEFVDYFKAGRGETSWVGSLQPAVTFTVGPLSSALTNRFGCRPVTVAGAILAAVGFMLSMFAPNLYYLYFTSGIMAGLGFGLIYLPAIVSVAQYFEKRRSFATGLAVCGSGFGTFLLAPITEAMVHTYQWQGAMLLLGALLLNVVACGLVFRPLKDSKSSSSRQSDSSSGSSTEQDKLLPGEHEQEWKTKAGVAGQPSPPPSEAVKKPTSVGDVEIVIDVSSVTGRLIGQGEGGLSTEQCQTTVLSTQQHNTLSNGSAVPISPSESEGWTPLLIESDSQQSDEPAAQSNFPANVAYDKQIFPAPSLSQTTSHDVRAASSLDQITSPLTTTWESQPSPPSEIIRVSSVTEKKPTNKVLLRPEAELTHLSFSQCLVPEHKPNPVANLAMSEGALNHYNTGKSGKAGGVRHRNRQGHSTSESYGNSLAPLTRKDILYSGSLYNIPMYRSQPDVYKAAITPHETSTSHDQTDQPKDSSSACINFTRELRQTLHDMLSFSLLRNPVFLMFAVSNFFTSIGFNMPFIFLPDRAKLSGIDEDRAAWLLSVIGIANTAGRVIFGFLSDRSWVNRLMLYNTALTICGLATAVSPVVGSNYALLVTYAAVFGLFIGVYVSLTSIVLVDLLGLEYLTNSFGLLLLFQGAATFVGPPIAGWLCDWTGSYDISFIVMGSLIALSGAMLYFLPLVQRYHTQRVPDLPRDIKLGKVAIIDSGGENSRISLSSS